MKNEERIGRSVIHFVQEGPPRQEAFIPLLPCHIVNASGALYNNQQYGSISYDFEYADSADWQQTNHTHTQVNYTHGGQFPRKLDFKADGAIQVKVVIETVLVVDDSRNEADHKASGASALVVSCTQRWK
jgi:hypothetical protein